MSLNTMERVLFDLHTRPDLTEAFHREPAAFLARYPLEEQERGMLTDLQVRRMADLGVSQMLLFCAWQAVHGGGASVPAYMQRMNTPAS